MKRTKPSQKSSIFKFESISYQPSDLGKII